MYDGGNYTRRLSCGKNVHPHIGSENATNKYNIYIIPIYYEILKSMNMNNMLIII